MIALSRFAEPHLRTVRTACVGLALLGLAATLTGAAAEALPRIAILSDAQGRPSADLLLLELQKTKCELVERDEIARILGEQALQQAMGRNASRRIGGLLRADGLILISSSTNKVASTRLVAVAPGIVVWAADAKADNHWPRLVAESMAPQFPKLSVKANDAVPISLLRVRPAFGMARAIQLADDLSRLLLHKLTCEPAVFVLERENLTRVDEEAAWSGKDSEFWAGSYVVEGRVSFDLVQTNRITLTLSVRPPPDGSRKVTDNELTETADASELPAMVQTLARRLCASVGTSSSGQAWDMKAEGQRLIALAPTLEDPAQQKAALATAMTLGCRDGKTAGAYRDAARAAAYRDPTRFSGLDLRLAPKPGLEKQAQDFLDLIRFHNNYQPAEGFTPEQKARWLFCYFPPLADIEGFLAAVAAARRQDEIAPLLPEIQAECRQTAANMLAARPHATESLLAVRTARYWHPTAQAILDQHRKWLLPPETDPLYGKLNSTAGLWFTDPKLSDPVFPTSGTEPAPERDRLRQQFMQELTESKRPDLRINMAIHRLNQAKLYADRVKCRREFQRILYDHRELCRFGQGSGLFGYAFPGFRGSNGVYSVASANGYDLESANAEDLREDARQAVRLFLWIAGAGMLADGDTVTLVRNYLEFLPEQDARDVYRALCRYMPVSPFSPRFDILRDMEWVTDRFPAVMGPEHRAELERRADAKLAPEDSLRVSATIQMPVYQDKFKRQLPSILGYRWIDDLLWFCWSDSIYGLNPTTGEYREVPLDPKLGDMPGNCWFSRVYITDSFFIVFKRGLEGSELSTRFGFRAVSGGDWNIVELPFEVRNLAQVGKKFYLLTAVRQITVYQGTGLAELDSETLQCRTLRAPGMPPAKVTPRPDGGPGFEAMGFDETFTAAEGLLVGSIGRKPHGWDPETGKVRPVDVKVRLFAELEADAPMAACRAFGFEPCRTDGLIRMKTPHHRLPVVGPGISGTVHVPLLFTSAGSGTGQVQRLSVPGVADYAIPTPYSLLVPCTTNRVLWQVSYASISNWLAVNHPPAGTAGATNIPPDQGSLVLDLGRGTQMEFRWIPPGEFDMGSPASEAGHLDNEKQHRVKITRGFWMGKYEVTREQWQRLVGNNPEYSALGPRAPTVVGWETCAAFIGKLSNVVQTASRQTQSLAGFAPRLPTEAEWEYACRAGTKTALNNGLDVTIPCSHCPNLDGIAWYLFNAGLVPGDQTYRLVGLKAPNAWGLHDMHGNVWEWCQDWYGEYPDGEQTDPQGPREGTCHVARGGGYMDFPGYCRSAIRCRNSGGITGFRVVLAPVER